MNMKKTFFFNCHISKKSAKKHLLAQTFSVSENDQKQLYRMKLKQIKKEQLLLGGLQQTLY